MTGPSPNSSSVWTGPRGGIALTACLLPACALLASRSVVLVLAAGALLSLWSLAKNGHLAQIPRGPLATLIAALIPWAGITLLWTLQPAIAAGKLATVCGILVAALVLNAAARQAGQNHTPAIGTAVVGGFIAGAGILAVDLTWNQIIGGTLRALFSPGSTPLAPEAVNQGACVLAIMVWPAALVIWRRGQSTGAAGLVIVIGLLTSATPSASAGLTMAIAALGGGLVYWGGARAARALGGTIAGLALLAPAVPLTVMQPARLAPYLSETALPELHRLHLWEFVAENIMRYPLGGWGFFASRHMPGGAAELFPGVPLMALHPHNGALQAWLELGLPGAILLAVTLYYLVVRTSTSGSDRATAAAMTSTVLAVLSIGSLSYGLWQSWWLAALGITGAVGVYLSFISGKRSF